MSRLRQSQGAGVPTSPSQMPQGQPMPSGAGPQVSGGDYGTQISQLLTQALEIFVASGASPDAVAAVEGFLTAIQQLAEQTSAQPQGQMPQGQVPAGPVAAPGMMAQSAPSPMRQ